MSVPSRDLHKLNEHEATNNTQKPRVETKKIDTRIVPDSDDLRTIGVPEVRDDWPNQLWEAIRNAKDGSLTLKSVPLETVFEHPIMVEQNPESLYEDAGSEKLEGSKASSLKTIPSFLGESEHNSIIRKLPIQAWY